MSTITSGSEASFGGAFAYEVFVDAAARTGGDGSAGCPCTDLATALTALRRMRAARNEPGLARITMRGGFYENTSVELGPEDSALVIAAAPGETPVLAGGSVLRDWHDEGDGVLACDIPGAREGTRDFRCLIVNGQFAERARYPESGTLMHESRFDVEWRSSSDGGWARKPTQEELTTLRYRGDDLGPWLAVRNAEVQIFHQWDDSLVGLAAIDESTKILTFSSPGGSPAGAFAERTEKARTYIVWNIREGLTQPGQWMLDRERGKVLYRPRPGETANNVCALAPSTYSIIRLHAPATERIHDLTLRGLELTAAGTPLRSGGFGARNMPGAIEFAGGTDRVCIEDCFIHHTGGHGIHGGEIVPGGPAPFEVLIRRCRIEDCGAGGISLRLAHRSTIEDCRLFRFGHVYTSSLALLLHGDGVRIAHNEIGWCPYSAIGVCGTACRVENNRIHHFMEQLDDGAAIYGFSMKQSLYRGNFVAGPGCAERLAHAYYLDEQSDGSVVEQNLAVGTGSPAHNHMSRHCVWRDNIFLDDSTAKFVFARCHRFFFERNVIVAKSAAFLGPCDMFAIFQQNLLVTAQNNVIFEQTGDEDYSVMKLLSPTLECGNACVDPGVQVDADGVITFRQPQLLRERGMCLKTDYRDAGPRV